MEVNENILNFNKICRLCLNEESLMSCIHAETDKHSSNVPLPLRIMACVPIELNSDDGLPSQICTACLFQVDNWFKFKDLCEAADRILKRCLNKEPVETEALFEIRSKANEVKQIVATAHLITSKESLSTHHKKKTSKKSIKKAEKGNVDGMDVLKVEQQTSSEENLEMFSSPFGNGNDDELERTDTPLGFSSDDDLPLATRKKKMLVEVNRAKTRKKPTKKPWNDVRYLRTVEIQTEGEEEDGVLEVIETLEIKGEVERKKTKSRKTQTPKEQVCGGGKKRFRVRPAVPSSCNLCDKVYKNSEILRQHIKSHHVSGTIECPSCKITFTSLRSLKYHEQRKHSNLEPVPCTFCGKKFLDKKYLRIHENIHSQANHFVCQFCGRKFIMKTNLTVHISRHHTKKSNDFICQICGKAFPFKLYLKKHFKTHTDYKPYECTYCEAKFRENTLLRKHVNSIHLKLRPFLCQYCHKTFTRSLYLREHMESQHLGIQRKVECSRCGETFQNRNRLRQHECLGRMEMARIE